jgi:hypothetical protein
MARYRVELVQTIVETAVVWIEANNEREAEERSAGVKLPLSLLTIRTPTLRYRYEADWSRRAWLVTVTCVIRISLKGPGSPPGFFLCPNHPLA